MRAPGQMEQHYQILKGFTANAHPATAHRELLLRLTNVMLQSHGWLQRLAERCAQQHVELPEECAAGPVHLRSCVRRLGC